MTSWLIKKTELKEWKTVLKDSIKKAEFRESMYRLETETPKTTEMFRWVMQGATSTYIPTYVLLNSDKQVAVGAIHRLRAGFNSSNGCAYKRHLTNSPLCEVCSIVETEEHMLVWCPVYADYRCELMTRITEITQRDDSIEILDDIQTLQDMDIQDTHKQAMHVHDMHIHDMNIQNMHIHDMHKHNMHIPGTHMQGMHNSLDQEVHMLGSSLHEMISGQAQEEQEAPTETGNTQELQTREAVGVTLLDMLMYSWRSEQLMHKWWTDGRAEVVKEMDWLIKRYHVKVLAQRAVEHADRAEKNCAGKMLQTRITDWIRTDP